jgi:hypothetical protein
VIATADLDGANARGRSPEARNGQSEFKTSPACVRPLHRLVKSDFVALDAANRLAATLGRLLAEQTAPLLTCSQRLLALPKRDQF